MALIGRLLTAEDYYFLLRTRSLDEFLGYLTATAYGPVLKDWNPHAPEAEKDFSRRLSGDLTRAYLKVGQGLKERERGFIHLLGQRLVAENLKVALRAVHQGLAPRQAAPLLAPLNGLTEVDFAELLNQGSVPAATDYLASTAWGPPLRRALPRYVKEQNLFPVEMSLDLWVFQRLWQGGRDLAAGDRRLAENLLSVWADAANIVWVARFREFYGFSGEEIYQYLLEAGKFRNPQVRRRLAFASGLRDMVPELPPPYAELLQGAENVAEVETRLRDHWRHTLTRVLSLPPFQIGLPMAYLFLKEMEILDLVTMMTGLRLNLGADGVRPYLRGKAAGGRYF